MIIYRNIACPRVSLLISTAAAALLLSVPVNAQERKPPRAEEQIQDDFHDRRVDQQITVTAPGISQLDVLAGTSVLEGVELQRNLSGQVGDILAKLPGVSTSSFTPGVSRPVLRGFSGERVKVLIDGIGAIDASNTSADHAVSIDPLTAERIEVLRGPAVMLYGSQAIGGAVNVIDKRIPLRMLKESVHVDALLGADTVSKLRQGGASIDLPLGNQFVVHFDGSYRETDDLTVPGYVASDRLRADLFAEADAVQATDAARATELRDAADIRGTLPNSATKTYSGNAGFAFFEGDSNLGAAIGVYDTEYGVPTIPGGEEIVTISLHQTRADARGELALGDGFLKSLHTRFGYSDYTHSELEDGEVGTTFNVKGFEARAVAEQTLRGDWSGSTGFQYYFRDFEAVGDEAYIAPNLTNQIALFTMQEVDIGPLQLEIAGRYENTNVKSQQLNFDRNYDSLSGAVSLAYETGNDLRFGMSGSRAERAPSAEEMLADGAHIATQAFEIGDENLTTEKALGAEIFVRGSVGTALVNVSLYKSWFTDYIYLNATGFVEDGLPVFQYLQGDANYSGIEGELSVPLVDNGGFKILVDFRGDYVRANLQDGTPLPRIPPFSLLGALEAQTDRLDGRIEVQYSGSQNRAAPLETPTGSFTFVNASIAWKPLRGTENLTLLLQADNIFDVEGRRAASFTKEFMPLAGRNFKISARASF